MTFSPRDSYLSLERKLDRRVGSLLVTALSPFFSREEGAAPPPEPRRILLVKLHGVGNVVLLLPAMRRLRRRFPDAEIDFLSFRTNEGILEGTEELHRCHYLDRGTPFGLLASSLRVLLALRRRSYDLAIDFDQFAHLSALFTLVTGAPRRIGFRNPTLSRHRGYTLPVVYLDMDHVTRTFARLTRAAGVPDLPEANRRISLRGEHRREAEAFLREAGIAPGGPFAVLHPGSSENLKLRRWPAERFAALGDRLSGELGCPVVITGTREELPLAGEVAGRMANPPANAAGRLSIRSFAALCEKASFVVSNDTAAVHVASAMGTPVVGLYGPNTPFLYGPLGANDLVFYPDLPCSPCLCNITSKLSDCRRARCMEEISVESVFDGIRGRYFPASDGAPP